MKRAPGIGFSGEQGRMADRPTLRAVHFANCGAEVGLGHLRRSLVLASALHARGVACDFYTPEGAGADLAMMQGFATADWPVSGDLPAADLLIADSYDLPLDLQQRWRGRYGLRVVIDDLADRAIDGDLVLNGNIFAETLSYSCPSLLGPAYALIDPAFHAARRAASAVPKRVLIAFGGSDDGHIGQALALLLLQQSPEVRVDLVTSPLHKDIAVLADMPSNRLTVHHGADMPALMAQACLYLGGAGTMVLEAMAAGRPMVVAALADNQHANVRALQEAGVPAFDRISAEQMVDAALHILSGGVTPDLSMRLTEGGAERAADAILSALRKRREGEDS